MNNASAHAKTHVQVIHPDAAKLVGETFWQRAVDDPTAIATFFLAIFTGLLALTTVAAIAVPLVQKRREAKRDAERARQELLSLLTALSVALGKSNVEAAWSASAGIDVIVARILQPDIMSALPPPIGQHVINAVMRAARHLHNDETRALARREVAGGLFRSLQTEATESRRAIQAVQAEIQSVNKSKKIADQRPAPTGDAL